MPTTKVSHRIFVDQAAAKCQQFLAVATAFLALAGATTIPVTKRDATLSTLRARQNAGPENWQLILSVSPPNSDGTCSHDRVITGTLGAENLPCTQITDSSYSCAQMFVGTDYDECFFTMGTSPDTCTTTYTFEVEGGKTTVSSRKLHSL